LQTFLPYADFKKTAECLDNKRLGKQRVEALTILRVLAGEVKGWRHHPAVLMWKGYENALVAYGLAICDEWIRRGFKDRCRARILCYKKKGRTTKPPWLGDPEFHRSHQSNLVRKNPMYRGYFNVADDLPYIWPVTISRA
jgi:hypothetical protein